MTANRTSSKGREPISQEGVISFLAARTMSELSSWLAGSPQEIRRKLEEMERNSTGIPIDSQRSQESASQWEANLHLAGQLWGNLSRSQQASLQGVISPLLPPDQPQDLWNLLESAAPLKD